MRDASRSTSSSSTPLADGDDAPSLPRRSGPIRWDRWLLVIGVSFGLLFLVVLPPANSHDDPSHLVRIDQIAHGHLVAPLDARHFAIARVDGCLGTFLLGLGASRFDQHWRPGDALRQYTCGRSGTVQVSNVALNGPLSYAPAVVGYITGRLLGGVRFGYWLARICGLIAYLGLTWLAVRITPVGKPFLMLVALLPTPLMLATTLSPDPVTISLGLLSVALVLRLRLPRAIERPPDPTRRLLVGLAGCLILLSLSKNLYAVMGLLVLLVPAERFSSPRRRWLYGAGVLATIAAAFVTWTVLVLNRVRVLFPFRFGDSFVQRAWIHAHPVAFVRIALHSAFGTMLLPTHTWPTLVANMFPARSTHNVAAPPAVSLIVLALAVLALAMSRSGRDVASLRRSAFDRAAVVVIPLFVALSVLALVLYGEAITFTPPLAPGVRITFVEGRFFLPVLGVLLLPLSHSTRVDTEGAVTWARRTVLLGSAGLLVWSVAWILDAQY